MKQFMKDHANDIKEFLIVSGFKVSDEATVGQYTIDNVEGLSIDISHSEFNKCERCWTYDETVGKDETHKTLCARCCRVIE